MRRLIAALFFCASVTAGYADAESARALTHQLKDKYWNCLAAEGVQALPRKMSGQDFVIFIRGRCLDQLKHFRIALVDYLALKHPDVEMRAHLAAADQVIQAAIDDIASTYVDLKSAPAR
jgi:hypothetical protein